MVSMLPPKLEGATFGRRERDRMGREIDLQLGGCLPKELNDLIADFVLTYEIQSFQELGFKANVRRAIRELCWFGPTHYQRHILKALIEKRNVILSPKECHSIPIVCCHLTHPDLLAMQCLVLTPSRTEAIAQSIGLKRFAEICGLTVAALGLDSSNDRRSLVSGVPIVTSSVARLHDLLSNGLSSNGLSSNGLSSNGLSSNGFASIIRARHLKLLVVDGYDQMPDLSVLHACMVKLNKPGLQFFITSAKPLDLSALPVPVPRPFVATFHPFPTG